MKSVVEEPRPERAGSQAGKSRRDFLKMSAVSGAALASGGVLAACGGSSSTKTAAKTSGPVRLTTAKFDWVPNDLAYQQKLATQFHQTHPNITVVPASYPTTTEAAYLTSQYASSSPPDIVYHADNTWVEFAAAGALLDITDRVKDPAYAKDYEAIPQHVWDSVTYKGRIWGIPIGASLDTQIVNLDLLEAAGATGLGSGLVSPEPWSYDDMRTAVAEVSKKRPGTYGFATGGNAAAFDWTYALNYLYSNGGELVTSDGALGLNQTTAEPAWDLLRNIVVVDKAAAPLGLSTQGLVSLFTAGKLAVFEFSAVIATCVAPNPKGLPFKWQARLIPAGPSGSPAGRLSTGVWCVSKKTTDPDAAFLYAEYLTSASTVTNYVKSMFGGLDVYPARTDISLWDPKIPLQKASREMFLELFPHGKPGPQVPQEAGIVHAMGTQYEALLQGKQSAAEMVKNTASAITPLLGA